MKITIALLGALTADLLATVNDGEAIVHTDPVVELLPSLAGQFTKPGTGSARLELSVIGYRTVDLLLSSPSQFKLSGLYPSFPSR